MLKYTSAEVVFREFPDETTLAFNISNCPIHCKGCHSKYLWEDIGEPLTIEAITKEYNKINQGVTCIGLMGGDTDAKEINNLTIQIKSLYPYLNVGWYSGSKNGLDKVNLYYFDYVKVGPYKEEYGGLDNPHTNQILYKILHNQPKSLWALVKNITSEFWKKKV